MPCSLWHILWCHEYTIYFSYLLFSPESTDEEDGEDDAMMPSESEDFLASDDLGVDDEEDEDDEKSEDGDEDYDNDSIGNQSTESSSEDDKKAALGKKRESDDESGMECDA